MAAEQKNPLSPSTILYHHLVWIRGNLNGPHLKQENQGQGLGLLRIRMGIPVPVYDGIKKNPPLAKTLLCLTLYMVGKYHWLSTTGEGGVKGQATQWCTIGVCLLLNIKLPWEWALLRVRVGCYVGLWKGNGLYICTSLAIVWHPISFIFLNQYIHFGLYKAYKWLQT